MTAPAGNNGPMSKKIDTAYGKLSAALEKHADLASRKKTRRGRIEAAAADVRKAATKYAAVVSARTDTTSPFADIADPRLDQPTVASLQAERDALALRRPDTALTPAELQVPLPPADGE